MTETQLAAVNVILGEKFDTVPIVGPLAAGGRLIQVCYAQIVAGHG
jgi:hypothetical protein